MPRFLSIDGLSRSVDLIRKSSEVRSYDRALSDRLIAVGKDASEGWHTRRMAALMLQRQFLLLPPTNAEEHDYLFLRLGLKERRGIDLPLKKSVLSEGFRSREMAAFVKEWRVRLSRLNDYLTFDSPDKALSSLECLSRSDCKLQLARYLFSPEEVVSEIMRGVRISRGEEMPWARDSEVELNEARVCRQSLPGYEARILDLLCDPSRIYWVTHQPVTEINSLVEYPKGAVSLAVKPPGSWIEFQIKRSGIPGPQVLSAAFEHNGAKVPDSHRLHGGGIGWDLRFEACSAARFCRIYRAVHGVAPSISITHRIKSICSIPTENGDCSTLDFFNTPQAFGEGYESMRIALKQCVQAGFDSGNLGKSDLPGEMGYTLNFLIQSWPSQSIQSNTSSFRLDRLAAYLCRDGPMLYRRGHAEGSHTREDARWFADQLLDEVLPGFERPLGRFVDFESYIRKTLAMPENRHRANETFIELMRQLGTFWGTLAAVKGYSNGECFVSRNVGLRSVWSSGRWQVKLFFMDHDDLHVGNPNEGNLAPGRMLRGMVSDQIFCVGYKDKQNSRSCFHALGKIYRVNDEILARGRNKVREARDDAVRKTLRGLRHNISLRDNFSPAFLSKAAICDTLWTAFRKRRTELLAKPQLLEGFVRDQLSSSSYDESRILQHAKALSESSQHFLLNPDI
jgi:hypothetical protein